MKPVEPQSLPIRLSAGRKKWLLALLFSASFALAGASLIPRDPLMGYLTAALFGVGVLVSAVSLLPASSYLTLTAQGFTYSALFRKRFVPWAEVRDFGVIKVAGNQFVTWNYAKGHQPQAGIRRINKTASGVEAALPETYGMRAADLVQLMERIRASKASTAL